MRGRVVLRGIRIRMPAPASFGTFFLALCFLLGAFSGHMFSAICDPSAQAALTGYIKDYCALLDAGQVLVSLWRCALGYFSYAVLIFMFSFSSLGVVLIPALAGVFGFITMYTVSCFVLAFGRAGIVPAAALLAVRLLFSLPCFFLLADEAWPLSARLALISIRKGRHCEPVVYGSRYFVLFLLCILLLIIGICFERFLTPHLFRVAVRSLI